MSDYKLGLSAADFPENTDLSSDGFFPVIRSEDFYRKYRIPSEIDDTAVIDHLVRAIGDVNDQLEEWQTLQIEAGTLSLGDVKAVKVNEESVLVAQYQRAVFCKAKSEILKECQTVDHREVAENEAKTSEETADNFLRYYNQAVARIMGQSEIVIGVL